MSYLNTRRHRDREAQQLRRCQSKLARRVLLNYLREVRKCCSRAGLAAAETVKKEKAEA